jgi:hypothetical protein
MGRQRELQHDAVDRAVGVERQDDAAKLVRSGRPRHPPDNCAHAGRARRVLKVLGVARGGGVYAEEDEHDVRGVEHAAVLHRLADLGAQLAGVAEGHRRSSATGLGLP